MVEAVVAVLVAPMETEQQAALVLLPPQPIALLEVEVVVMVGVLMVAQVLHLPEVLAAQYM
jgi:hypothetical protein